MNQMETDFVQKTDVTDIGRQLIVIPTPVTKRSYEAWEMPLVGSIRNKHCKICGLEIVAFRYGNIGLWPGHAKICQPCRIEKNRIRRLNTRRKNREKYCLECNSFFSATRSDTKFCTNACKQKYFRDHKKKSGESNPPDNTIR